MIALIILNILSKHHFLKFCNFLILRFDFINLLLINSISAGVLAL
nr:MAG TPA: hypothetical protein [Caudoviricetes sp.]